MAESRKKQFARKGEQILGGKPGSMEELMKDTSTHNGDITTKRIAVDVDAPTEIRKTTFIDYDLTEKIRLLVFQKKYKSERAVFEAALKLLMKKEGI
ncbi:MAG: hypothetical protein HGA69_00600 [Desulfobulbaceae bacterium]|nr:hypothetical protein [Desulfobulbaceae bacterium]